MLSDIIAPGRLRAGDPQALAALVAVGGWSVASYCALAGAGDDVAAAVVLAFVTFRRRAVQAGEKPAVDLERLLLESVRDAVDEVRGEPPAEDESRAAEAAFARASPRPLSPRLATAVLRALAEAAPVDGDPLQVAGLAERGYAAAYTAAAPAAAVAGEERLGSASALLLDAAEGRQSAPAPAPAAPRAQREAPAARPTQVAPPPLADRLRALPPAQRAVGFAGAIVVVLLLAALLFGGDDEPAQQPAATVAAPAQTVTVTRGAPVQEPARRSQVVRGRPRRAIGASGASFAVMPTAGAGWARRIRQDEPRTGTRWLTVAVRSRNVRRGNLVLRTLGFRLRTASGRVLGPRLIEVAGGPQQARQGRLPKGTSANVHLAFEVPFEAGGLALLFEPGGLDEPTVVVALGDADQPS